MKSYEAYEARISVEFLYLISHFSLCIWSSMSFLALACHVTGIILDAAQVAGGAERRCRGKN